MITRAHEVVGRLTSADLPVGQRRVVLREFASVNGWHPSDELDDYPGTTAISNGHLVVEHGLDTSAVITFLKDGYLFGQLPRYEQNQILAISYNNLVDWHLFPDLDGTTVVFNRADPVSIRRILLADDAASWRAEAFDRIIGRRPNPNLKNLEDALIETVSRWKKLLAVELGSAITNDATAALFNAIIFVRALEDQRTHERGVDSRVLRGIVAAKPSVPINQLLRQALRKLGVRPRSDLISFDAIEPFAELDPATVSGLISDFYDNRFAPYPYDFSLMSKHALSRIYEHYVSLLSSKTSPQLRLFPDVPDEVRSRATGSIYTPQYIARFFARFLKENLTPKEFRQLRACDPACGSGIFLRTLLEMQCDPLQNSNVSQVAHDAFSHVEGVDVDANAVQATRLSLSLLHLVLTGQLPKKRLRIIHAEAIEHYSNSKNSFDAVLGNPPFIKWDHLAPRMKQVVSRFMADYSSGKVDVFLAMLKASLDMLHQGGFLLFVLPHSFLFATNARELRDRLANDFSIRFLADISQISVFNETAVYVILLIVQKREPSLLLGAKTTVLQCRDFVGRALQDVLEGKTEQNSFYSIFDIEQRSLVGDRWVVVGPGQSQLRGRLQDLPVLDSFLDIQEGFITGADDVFIRPAVDVPKQEKDIYVPYLPDREMERYHVSQKTASVVFNPYVRSKKLSEHELRTGYPETWKYLSKHSTKLKQRSPVRSGHVAWWRPHRPSPVGKMLKPKIVVPHLILLPRFSFDALGRYAVSHSPWFTLKEDSTSDDLLRYFVAVLNSTVIQWQLATTSHRYSRGYLMLEKKTLRGLRVPDPSQISSALLNKILGLVDRRLKNPGASDLEYVLDGLVADAYELTPPERKEIGYDE